MIEKAAYMTENQLQQFLEDASKRGSVPGLDGIKKLLDLMGNPEQRLKTVHIAGTNGKGSVLAYVSSMLEKAGYKTGKYSSPAIVQYREIIQVNSRNISKKSLLEGMELIKNTCEQMVSEGYPHPTTFEIETALAFWYFDMKKCDICIIETGMGGLLDATNVIPAPIVSVLTSISMDHMSFLGNTIEEIAGNKAGIIKKGSVTVSAPQLPEVEGVLSDVAGKNNVALTYASEAEPRKCDRYSLVCDYGKYKRIKSSLLGAHQLINIPVAIETAECLRRAGYKLSDENIYEGIQTAQWFGRFSVVCTKPLIIADGAHNEKAADLLMKSVDMYIKNMPLIYIMGMFRDKEYEKVIDITCKRAAHVITVATPDNPRALPALELAEAVKKVNDNVTAASSVEEAMEMAKLLAGNKCAILTFGSLSFLGRIKNIIGN